MHVTAPKPKHRRASVRSAKTEPPALPFKVFIAYHDFPAVRHAMTAIDDGLRASRRRVNFMPMVWRFDQLSRVPWRERALADAADADVVVLASSVPGGLPPELEHWVGLFLARQRGTCTTLVALLGPNDAWTISVEPSAQSAAEPAPEVLAPRAA